MIAPFRPRFPWWGGDLQTLRNKLAYRPRPLPGEATPFTAPTPDGDHLTGTLHRPSAQADRALVMLLHGLTGSEDSMYMLESTRHHLARGHSVLRMNLRGAGSSEQTCADTYSSASWPDILTVLSMLEPADLARGVFIIGYSMGGNILLNALPHFPEDTPCIGAATVSAPIDPVSASRRLMQRRNWIYQRALLNDMKETYLARPESRDPEMRAAIEGASSIWQFDDRVTGPRNGYDSAQAYYEAPAGLSKLDAIRLPLLMIHAKDDPWIPVAPYLNLTPPQNVVVEITESGGHVGFHGADAQPWHDLRIAAFIDDLDAEGGAA